MTLNTTKCSHLTAMCFKGLIIITRYLPTDDLVNIYTELYGQSGVVTRDVINECGLFLFLER